jgi:hypothetical protein
MTKEQPDLLERARQAERDFHSLLEQSPGYLDYAHGALRAMDPIVGGV